MSASAQLKSVNMDLKGEIERLSGQKVDACYLCGKCSAGCPVAPYQDIPPHVVMSLSQWGSQKVLESRMIWSCASCGTCSTRCPNGIDVARICETLAQISAREGLAADKMALTLREKFVSSVANNGRIHEMSIVLTMKVASRDYFSDLDIGIPLFLKGRLPLSPHKIKDLNNFKKLIKIVKKGDK